METREEAKDTSLVPRPGPQADEVIQVEVERLPFPEELTGEGTTMRDRMREGFGPVLAGIVIDVVDFTTFGPLGLVVGLPAGAICGYWLAGWLQLNLKLRLLMALGCGIYCTLPPTSFLPVATVVATVTHFLRPDGRSQWTG